MTYDLIIIGSGIAGVTGAIYAKRSNLNVLIIEKSMTGGLLNKIDKINNYPGYKEINGIDFASNLIDQINNLDIEVINDEVINIELADDLKKVVTKNDEYISKTVLIATGRIPKKIGLQEEDSLYGNGLSTCALCDGNFFKNKDIAVIGGGNSALQEAIYLSNIAKKVYIVHRRDKFSADENLVIKAKEISNIEFVYNSIVTNINKENNVVNSIILNNKEELKVSGVFVYIGYMPGVNFVERLNITNERGYIITNGFGETIVPGIYAAGDIIEKQVYQLITAASEGAIAAINIIKYLEETR